jgi:hypothetical protein
MKRDGSRETELTFVTSLSKEELKRGLEQLDRMHLVRIDHFPRLIPTATNAKIYIPSSWARGNPVERITGPHVPSYVLNLSEELTVTNLEGKFKTSAEELLILVKHRVAEVKDSTWREYAKFARVVLTEIRLCSIRARAMYGDYLPRGISKDISLLLETFDEIELNCESRQTALAMLERAIRLLNESFVAA